MTNITLPVGIQKQVGHSPALDYTRVNRPTAHYKRVGRLVARHTHYTASSRTKGDSSSNTMIDIIGSRAAPYGTAQPSSTAHAVQYSNLYLHKQRYIQCISTAEHRGGQHHTNTTKYSKA